MNVRKADEFIADVERQFDVQSCTWRTRKAYFPVLPAAFLTHRNP